MLVVLLWSRMYSLSGSERPEWSSAVKERNDDVESNKQKKMSEAIEEMR